jgi:hypothetical protein
VLASRKLKIFSITLALIVTRRSTSLEIWTFFGPKVDDEIRAWNLTPHSGVWFFTNLPSVIRKSASRRLGVDFLDSSSSLTLFGPSTSPHPFLAVQALAVSAPFTVPHRSDLPDQRPKSPAPHSLLSFIVSPLSIRVIIIFGGKRRAHDDRIIDKTCNSTLKAKEDKN